MVSRIITRYCIYVFRKSAVRCEERAKVRMAKAAYLAVLTKYSRNTIPVADVTTRVKVLTEQAVRWGASAANYRQKADRLEELLRLKA